MKKSLIIKIVIIAVVVIVFGIGIFWLNHFDKKPLISTVGQSYEEAIVTEIIKDNLAEDGHRYGNQEVMVRIQSGAFRGEEYLAINPNGSLFGAECKVGSHVIVILSSAEENAVVTVYSKNRAPIMWVFCIIFAVIVCIVGGKKGLKAILSLVFTLVSILFVMFPLIYRGMDAIVAAILLCIISTVVTLWMIGGFSRKTVAAMAGTTFGVVAAGVFALVYGQATSVTGYNVSDIENLIYIGQNTRMQIGQLLFAGIIISSLGAVMDVGMSISSTIEEIHAVNRNLSTKELFLAGLHVGRDMMGTMVNTLILAFVGGALSMLMTNYAYDLSYNQLANSYAIAIEVMQGLAGSIGVVLTVPLTAAIAAKMQISSIFMRNVHK